MNSAAERTDPSVWAGIKIGPGERANVQLQLTESYTGAPVVLPVHVRRGLEPGPSLFISAALHGDEINGVGAIRQLLLDDKLELRRGTLVLVPVMNILGFERHSRYLPDRRDLNRCFPGRSSGSLSSRLARAVMDLIVSRCDFGIDLHTAALRRTNFPNIRADSSDSDVLRLANVFGSELVISSRGPKGSLRREACRANCATIILEAGGSLESPTGSCRLRPSRDKKRIDRFEYDRR